MKFLKMVIHFFVLARAEKRRLEPYLSSQNTFSRFNQTQLSKNCSFCADFASKIPHIFYSLIPFSKPPILKIQLEGLGFLC